MTPEELQAAHDKLVDANAQLTTDLTTAGEKVATSDKRISELESGNLNNEELLAKENQTLKDQIKVNDQEKALALKETWRGEVKTAFPKVDPKFITGETKDEMNTSAKMFDDALQAGIKAATAGTIKEKQDLFQAAPINLVPDPTNSQKAAADEAVSKAKAAAIQAGANDPQSLAPLIDSLLAAHAPTNPTPGGSA